uniref:NADH dehydrogenase subunit 6 n=1 Tax=Dipterosiphonia australica TaxID=2007208 RepID=UPI0022FD7271|nr:NADH dehydrogenase subunit 6 [Dipterosiphonia australica]WAX04232.1 NADH dehydrogenase subunit 6 [Dipterosiphonia australica]
MFFENFLFFIFYFLIMISALMVIFSENSVYSVFFLILTFCNVVFLLLFLGAEFLAFLLLIVYIGAIAVLFLFVVMMLNIKTSFSSINYFSLYYFPLLLVFFLIIFDYLFNFISFFDIFQNLIIKQSFTNWIDELEIISNIESIGNVLFTNYCLLFIIAGFVLFIAMIGVIVLTIHQKTLFLLKKQIINYQLIRNSKQIVKFIKIRK